ncbi:MAG: hypothetical protein AB1522_03130 [Chloroflexota bacterium]
MNQSARFRYSPALNKVVLQGLTEILGTARLDDLLASLPAEGAGRDLGSLRQVLLQTYGQQSSAGILMRAGRAAFARLLTGSAAELGFEDQSFRLLPPRRKIFTALQQLAGWLNRQEGGDYRVVEGNGVWQWVCVGRLEGDLSASCRPLCPFTMGMLQELTYWASSGRVYPLREEAGGKAAPTGCVIAIEQQPLD